LFNNGSSITQYQDQLDWESCGNTLEAAYCFYEGYESSVSEEYGLIDFNIYRHDIVDFAPGNNITITRERISPDEVKLTFSSSAVGVNVNMDQHFIFRDINIGSTIYHLDPDASWNYVIYGYTLWVDADQIDNLYLKKNGVSFAGPLSITTTPTENNSLNISVVQNDIITLEFTDVGSTSTELVGKIKITQS
jgi:hypothetical protein